MIIRYSYQGFVLLNLYVNQKGKFPMNWVKVSGNM